MVRRSKINIKKKVKIYSKANAGIIHDANGADGGEEVVEHAKEEISLEERTDHSTNI